MFGGEMVLDSEERREIGALLTRLFRGWRLRLAALLVMGWCAVLSFPGQASCHVTDTNMPDAVAEMEYQILLDFQPENTEVRNKLAMVLLRKKKFKEAEAELRAVLAKEPANYNALDGLGLVMNQTGRPEEAVRQHLAAIKINRQDAMAHYHLGQAYAAQGDLSAAQKAYRQALDLANQSGGQVSAADLEAIRKALEQNPSPSGPYPPAK